MERFQVKDLPNNFGWEQQGTMNGYSRADEYQIAPSQLFISTIIFVRNEKKSPLFGTGMNEWMWKLRLCETIGSFISTLIDTVYSVLDGKVLINISEGRFYVGKNTKKMHALQTLELVKWVFSSG